MSGYKTTFLTTFMCTQFKFNAAEERYSSRKVRYSPLFNKNSHFKKSPGTIRVNDQIQCYNLRTLDLHVFQPDSYQLGRMSKFVPQKGWCCYTFCVFYVVICVYFPNYKSYSYKFDIILIKAQTLCYLLMKFH